MRGRGLSVGVAGVVAVLAAVACGKEGRPVPPAPRGPLPAGLVEARQIGERVVVAFTVPEPRGGDEAQLPAAVEIVRVAYPPGLTVPSDPEAFRLRGEVVARLEGGLLEPGSRLTADDPTVGELERGLTGWTLRYGVRVRDRRGRPSPLVAAADLTAVGGLPAPAAPSAEATSEGVRLEWTGGSEGTKYNLYRGREEQALSERPLNAQPLPDAAYLDASVETGVRYRYVVRVLAGEGVPLRESASSPEVAVLAEDRFPPAAPTGLVAVQEGAAVRLFWTPGVESDLGGYRLYRRAAAGDWERIGADPLVEPLFLDGDVLPGMRVSYRVTALDRAAVPNESPASEPIEVNVVADPLQSSWRKP